jgi:hypothetical protein
MIVRAFLLFSATFGLFGCSRFLTSEVLQPGDPKTLNARSLGAYALPRGLIQISSRKADGDLATVTVKALYIPDGSVRYSINHDRSWFADDIVQVTTNKDGLLKTVWSDVQDRTDEVLVDLARAVGAVQGFTVQPGGSLRAYAPDAHFNLIIDPRELDKKPDWVEVRELSGSATNNSVQTSQPADCSAGVCTRPLKPWLVRIRLDDMGKRYHDAVVYLPDEKATFAVRADRSFMGDKKFYLSFNSGVIEQVYLHEPSSAEALAELPYNVIKQILSVPSEMLALRFKYANDSKGLATAEMQRIQEEAKYRNYLLSLQQAAAQGQDSQNPSGAQVTVSPSNPPGQQQSGQTPPVMPPYGLKPQTTPPPTMEPDVNEPNTSN